MLFATLITIFLGCATTHQTPQDTHLWTAKGKIGVRQEKSAKSLNFIWINHNDGFEIRMYGSLGIGNIKISQDGNSVVLTTNKGTTQANSAESLLYDVTGWAFPVRALEYWIRAETFPDSKIDSITHDNNGNIRELNQEGWHLDYQRYHSAETANLPQKIVAKREGISLTLVIKSWQ